MSNRWGSSESRWSSERERAERERREQDFDARKARPPSRRSSWRDGTAGSTPPAPPEEPASPIRETRTSSSGTATGGVAGEKASPIGRKWRESVTPPADDDSSLPNLPGDDGDDGGSRGGGRILIFGAVLFLLMAILAFTPFGPLGSNNDSDDPEPTVPPPVAVVPTSPEQDPNSRNGVIGSPAAQRPADSETVVCIDPGHGGWDFGRQRQGDEYNPPRFNESEVNLAMALMLRDELVSRDVTVVMTRESGTAANVFGEDVNGDGRTILDGAQDGDRDELQARINICNDANADVLISLHLNGFDDQSARGFEILYTPAPTREFGDQNLDLGNAIYREIGAAYNDVGFETDPRGVKSDETLDAETHEFGSERNLVLTGPAVNNPDYSIVPSAMPGVIVEPVFISNQEDTNFIVLPENQRLLAVAYADGIMNYFDQYPG